MAHVLNRKIDRQMLVKFAKSDYAKAGILCLLFLALFFLIYSDARPFKADFHEGDVSPGDIFAPLNFEYPGDIDTKRTDDLKRAAAKTFLPVYAAAPDYWSGVKGRIAVFFDELAKHAAMDNAQLDDKVKRLKKAAQIEDAADDAIIPLFKAKLPEVEARVDDIINDMSSKYIIDSALLENLKKGGWANITVTDKKAAAEATVETAALSAPEDIKTVIRAGLQGAFPHTASSARDALAEVLLYYLKPNIAYEEKDTLAGRRAVVDSIKPVYNMVQVKRGELIVGQGQRIKRPHILQLNEINTRKLAEKKVHYFGGLALVMAIFLLFMFVYLDNYAPKLFKEAKNAALIAVVSLFVAIMAKGISKLPVSMYFTPFACGSMLLAILLDEGIAFITTIILSVFIGAVAGDKFGVVLVFLISGSAGIYFVRRLHRRSQLIRAGIFVGLINFIGVCAMGFINDVDPNLFFKEALWGFGSGIVSAGIIMVFLSVFESVFKITTDFTLLELSDLNHPLLKRLVLEAPGTYHHSLVVGNLAEAASDTIGANSLLARVGAYYHDIGKLEKPEYFSENEQQHKSAHDKLVPSMSALVITSHVKDGVELARKHKLSDAIIEFISQHHGTSLIYYFYQRALERAENEQALQEESFRYPGPKPQSKEAAIVLLADAVEAACRALDDPTPARIKGLVQKIINNKFIDNQLDECDLTLKDLNKIAESFVRILQGIFHTRIDYPEETRDKGKNGKG